MILSAHQPAYMPWLGYLHKIALCDRFVILDNVQFEKNSFINRNQIKSPNGPIWLTIPVLLTGHTRLTVQDIKIDNSTDWRNKHWKSILFNYKKAPFFGKYSDYFEQLYKKDWIKLVDIIDDQLKFFLNTLNIKTPVLYQSKLQIKSKKQELIVDLCRKTGSDIFVFGALGKDYAQKEIFDKNHIKIYFQEYQHPIYSQLRGDFLPNLSALDLIFNVCAQNAMDIIAGGNINKDQLKDLLKEQ